MLRKHVWSNQENKAHARANVYCEGFLHANKLVRFFPITLSQFCFYLDKISRDYLAMFFLHLIDT